MEIIEGLIGNNVERVSCEGGRKVELGRGVGVQRALGYYLSFKSSFARVFMGLLSVPPHPLAQGKRLQSLVGNFGCLTRTAKVMGEWKNTS